MLDFQIIKIFRTLMIKYPFYYTKIGVYPFSDGNVIIQ